ncbi:PTS glucose transporter subunit IIA [Rothia sp. ZJ932]|nr:PTS glucose transporter subunit IIA [Rothia sp. ZJ932]
MISPVSKEGLRMAGFFSKIFGGSSNEQQAPVAPVAAATGGNQLVLGAHMNGTVHELSQVSDPTFSTGALGPGAAIEPTEGVLYAPADGELTVAFPTGHAVGIRTPEGVELLIHIGFDTVELDGKHFDIQVKKGDKVKRGDVLVKFDLEAVKAAGYDITTPLVATNHKRIVASTSLHQSTAGSAPITAGDDFLVYSLN